MTGKQLAFDDPRSALFFQFVRLLEGIKPKYFLLENVKMKKEYLQVITDLLGVEPIFINSALVSAQSRQRYYWTNIPNIEQPEERGILLKDVLEDDFQTDKDKSYCIDANYHKGGSPEYLQRTYKTKAKRQAVFKVSAIRNKSKTVRSGGRLSYDRHEWDSVDELHWRKLTPLECERLQTVPDNYTEGVSNTQRYKMLGNGWTVEVIKHILGNM